MTDYRIVIKDDRPRLVVKDQSPTVVVADKGIQGPLGPVGPQGIEGPIGPTGIQGEVGAMGPQGPAMPVDIQGTGKPEGVVTAPVGKTYRDEAGTNGAWLWIKASGTGSTGWNVVYGDTGRRDVTALVPAAAGWSHKDNGGIGSRKVTIRRQGNMVTFACLMDSGTYVGPVTDAREVLFLPNGFKNTEYAMIGIGGANSNNVLAGFSTTGTIGRVYVRGYGTGNWSGYMVAEYTFRTGDVWPTNLPGTAA